MKRLLEIQQKLKAPKAQFNDYGGYQYRSCEDILEAVKPLLKEQNLILTLKDELIAIDGRFYIKAIAQLWDENGKELTHTTAIAREPESKKGMDEAQITGATSSYSRKYALNGLFAINDVKDPDAINKHGKDEEAKKEDITCPVCGKKTTSGALESWGKCVSCKQKEAKKDKKDA